MESCTLPALSYRNSTHSFTCTRQLLNPSCPSLPSVILNASNRSSTSCSSGWADSSSCCNGSYLGSRRRAHRVKPISALGTSRGSLSTSWNLDGTSSGLWMPRMEDLDSTNMLLRQRIVFLGSQVDDISADFIISQLLFLDAEDPTKDIKLFINSPGGSVTAGMGVYDAMKLCKADVATVCFGLAASMGAFLLASGTKGKRFCMPNSRVMIHQPLGGAGGTATEIGLQIREMMYHKIKLTKIMSRLTGKSEEQIENDTDRDYFMNAWEAVEYGIVDSVIDDGKPGLVAPTGEVKPPPQSRVWEYWTIKDRKDRKHLPSEKYIMKEVAEEEDTTKISEEKDSNQVGEEKAAAV